ncbi:MAG: VOC family protein [Bacteroidota bacterium]
MKRVTGIGGIFFKCDDPKKMKSWYNTHLGIQTDQYGGVFRWKSATKEDQTCYTAWSPFSHKSTYFEPSKKEFMFNYRVDDLEALLAELKKEGITVVGEIETYPYGKFGWILDPEGNKIELWEPVDKGFGYDEDYGTA